MQRQARLENLNQSCMTIRYYLRRLDANRPLTYLANKEYDRLFDLLIKCEDNRFKLLRKIYPGMLERLPPGRIHILG